MLELKLAIAEFQAPAPTSSIWQIGSTLLAFIAICALMYAALSTSYALTLGLAFVAAGLVVRIFIVQHDCGHGSFFASRRANNVVGRLCSLITLTPYGNWRRQHASHHAAWNNLDRRLSGSDIYSTCLTVTEYRGLKRRDRLVYRISRHPLISAVALPPLVFLLLYRVSFDTPTAWRRERNSVYATNLGLAAIYAGIGYLVGFERMLLVQLPILVVASIVGVWIFSVQHQFESALWRRKAQWRFEEAALRGTSYLRLPRVLQWFTGNIGFHHIHHLNPHVPNYRLEECYRAIPALRNAHTLSIWDGINSLSFRLWDERWERMVTFKAAQHIQSQ